MILIVLSRMDKGGVVFETGSGWRIGIILASIGFRWRFALCYPFNLGLDLKGGVHVVLKLTRQGDLLRMKIWLGCVIIERRINALGVSEPLIQRQGARR